MKKIYALPFLCLSLFSCDKFSFHHYKVTNGCNSNIKVLLTDDKKPEDIIVNIPVGEEVEIYEDYRGNTRVERKKETGEYISCFKKLSIYKADTVLSKTDFTRTSTWTYKLINKYKAEYLVT